MEKCYLRVLWKIRDNQVLCRSVDSKTQGKCQLSVKFSDICQLSVKILGICQLSVNPIQTLLRVRFVLKVYDVYDVYDVKQL